MLLLSYYSVMLLSNCERREIAQHPSTVPVKDEEEQEEDEEEEKEEEEEEEEEDGIRSFPVRRPTVLTSLNVLIKKGINS